MGIHEITFWEQNETIQIKNLTKCCLAQGMEHCVSPCYHWLNSIVVTQTSDCNLWIYIQGERHWITNIKFLFSFIAVFLIINNSETYYICQPLVNVSSLSLKSLIHFVWWQFSTIRSCKLWLKCWYFITTISVLSLCKAQLYRDLDIL
jgi:hypothetical protein